MIEGHGNDLYRYGDKVKSDFSSNVAARRVPDALLAFLATQLETIATYPEPDSETLRNALGSRLHVDANQVFVANGSVEAFYTIAAAFRQSRSLVLIPSFAEYEDACRMHDHTIFYKSNEQLCEAGIVCPQLVWLGNPNNPDGRLYAAKEIEEQLLQNPDTVFVVDEAYGELCSGFESVIDLVNRFDNLIVVHSMTKQYVLPGLRLGYMVTSRSLAARLRSFSVPWAVNALAQKVGVYLINNEELYFRNKENTLRRSIELQKRFSALPGITVIPSPCNFFLLRTDGLEASVVKEKLLNDFGLLVRDASNFRGLDNHSIRISVQTEEENEKLFIAMEKMIGIRNQKSGSKSQDKSLTINN
ncbi:aminotransferase class I/II-fold pyridoxal phosphate-dependent enzyme [Paludibacter sp.]|uniref:pyridoxal phosphate-dependent aminotransferase n=1 Tax=Paludibacter sp. TaxID=1898105 RepID=UPI001355F49B|nr:aminotransferase class I/II-fold pyridoxal phosphate-dependent enzyme [Paludibacter sp.]MTK54290.1 pyridoxal phosphate-dependent class II aminotransferase [Paludibacter sp.]